MQDVAKCNLACPHDDCGHKHSHGVIMNFKYYCIDGDKYFEKYPDGEVFRETKKEEEMVKIEA